MRFRQVQWVVAFVAFALTIAGAVWPARGTQALAALAASALAISLAAEQLFATPEPTGDEAVRATVSLIAVCFLTLGLSTIVAVVDRWGIACLWAGACLLGGGFLGMLFGVPLQGKGGQETNLLMQTADTLSKFIAGAALAKFGAIFQRFQDAAWYLAQCFQCCTAAPPPGGYNSALAGGVILYFSALGFVAGILMTRFYNLNVDINGAPPAGGEPEPGPPAEPPAVAPPPAQPAA